MAGLPMALREALPPSVLNVKNIREAIARRAGLAMRRARIVALVEHREAHDSQVAYAMNGLGIYAPKSANAGSRGPRRVFDRPASAYDEPLVAVVENTNAARPEGTASAAFDEQSVSARPGIAKTNG